MKFKIALFFIILSISCSEQKKTIDSHDTKMAILNNSEYIEWLFGQEYKLWQPNNSDINEIDVILEKAIENEAFKSLQIKTLKELKNRYRQYVCYLNNEGNKIVYINSFCKIPILYENGKEKQLKWRSEMVDIADGGNCYWNMKINLTSKTYFDVIINGKS